MLHALDGRSRRVKVESRAQRVKAHCVVIRMK